VDEQIEQVLNNLQTVLKDCGSDLDQLVRLNIYALAPSTVDRVRESLSKRLPTVGAPHDHLGPDAAAASRGSGRRGRGRRRRGGWRRCRAETLRSRGG
jgi:enamine deaminase RidA (YjgF/YER057c/UK114 family)